MAELKTLDEKLAEVGHGIGFELAKVFRGEGFDLLIAAEAGEVARAKGSRR